MNLEMPSASALSVFISYTVCLEWGQCICTFSSLRVFLVPHHSLPLEIRHIAGYWLKHSQWKISMHRGQNSKGGVPSNWFFFWLKFNLCLFWQLWKSNQCAALITFPEMTKKGCWLKRSLVIVLRRQFSLKRWASCGLQLGSTYLLVECYLSMSSSLLWSAHIIRPSACVI